MVLRAVLFVSVLLLSLGSCPYVWGDESSVESNTLGMSLVRLSHGEFEMGMLDEHRLKLEHKASAYQREIHDYVEKPSFPVRLSQDFSIGATEVTVSQFRIFVDATGYQTDAERVGKAWAFQPEAEDPLNRFSLVPGINWKNPGFEQTGDHPVTCISWHDAQAFCRWLGKKEGKTYRLPTEAEWEYACRAGTRSSYFSGEEPDGVYSIGNVADASLYALHPEDVLRQRTVRLEPGEGDGFPFTSPVKSFQPNQWGIYDTHGNVWEWCADKYSDRYYDDMLAEARQKGSRNKPEPILDPQGPEDTPKHEHGDWRSLRGGSWYVAPLQCRSSVRAFAEAHDAFSYIGFRVVREEE